MTMSEYFGPQETSVGQLSTHLRKKKNRKSLNVYNTKRPRSSYRQAYLFNAGFRELLTFLSSVCVLTIEKATHNLAISLLFSFLLESFGSITLDAPPFLGQPNSSKKDRRLGSVTLPRCSWEGHSNKGRQRRFGR